MTADRTTDYGVDALAIGAHPDDVELFCGGIVARLGQLGYAVGVADLTRGERASHGTPEERARETAAASEVLGLAFRDNVGLPDTELAVTTEQVTAVVALLRARRPELVLAPWPDDRHPDHVAAGRLVERALFFASVRKFAPETGGRFVPRQVLYYALRARITPSFVVDTSAAAEQKLRAIACYASQVQRPPGGDATLISAPGAIAAIEARDRYYGSMIGASHGEAVRSPTTPGLVDPLRHARDNPFRDAHATEAREA
ncbi:MAG: bacillithiol biosynthesis deacetylase BshB1 [Deltaproteobacteria bacterium]|nr:bacillithiol biosynthesis deacetylase BshB1 [Deltaproteobacteria bacterium]